MHPIDSLLEGLKVSCNRDYILVKRANLEFMILEVSIDTVLIGLRVNPFLQLCHIKLISDIDHTLIPTHQFLLKFDPKLIDLLLNLRFSFLFIQGHIW